jgi:DNA mismatch repair ATPase MutS
MALRDDIRSGESYFIVEIRSLKRVLDAASLPGESPVLCCVDEVLRGTNTIERISASAEILSSLAKMPIRIFAATHDMELTELLSGKYVNYHFSEMLDGDDVKFSYKLLGGPADSRNAIRLLRALGYDPAIADRAEARAKHFMETGDWEL